MDDTFQDVDLLAYSAATSVVPQEVLTAWASGVVGMYDQGEGIRPPSSPTHGRLSTLGMITGDPIKGRRWFE